MALSLRVAQNPSPKLCRPVHLSSTSNGHPAAVSTSLRPRYSRCNRWLLQEGKKVHIGRREHSKNGNIDGPNREHARALDFFPLKSLPC
ncbi:hypothetical protein V8C44DRAFT_337081 [Trichoderma aethiopicum]